MAPKKGTKASKRFAADAPWRAASGEKAIPRISHGIMFSVREGPNFTYAMSVMKHPDPVGMGLAVEAFVEPAGPDCLIPGLRRPIRLLGIQVWPLPFQQDLSLKVLEPIGHELKTVGKVNLWDWTASSSRLGVYVLTHPVEAFGSAWVAYDSLHRHRQVPGHSSSFAKSPVTRHLSPNQPSLHHRPPHHSSSFAGLHYEICSVVDTHGLRVLDKAFELMQAPFGDR